ncbi:CCD81 protein, partial [Anseranas semipalmata]|nr:CCD81 protein [Anseranas semipalmata]
MTTMTSFFWPREGDLRASERALFPTLMSLTTKEIMQIWDRVSLDIQRQLAASKSVRIAGLGTFAVLMQELHVGRKGSLLVRRPVFQLSNIVRKILNLTYARRIIPDSTPVVPLDYATIALETSNPLEAVENCLNETVMYLSHCISNELNIDFVFRDMGVLCVKQKRVKMRFYEKFLLSLDATGNFKEVLVNVSLAVF